MIEAARRELGSWGEGLVSLSRGDPARLDLILRLCGVHRSGGLDTTVSIEFERHGHWWIDDVTRAEVSPRQVVLTDAGGEQTRVARLLLPDGLERALHVGQFSTRMLDLPSIATPFVRSHTPPLSRRRPRAVVIWTEFAARSRLGLWWACASFSSASIWAVPVPRDRPAQEEVFAIRSPRELMAAAAGARRLTPRQVARFASNWRAWADGDARFHPVDLPGLPMSARWLGEVPEHLFDLFPRLEDGLQLSPYDHQLLALVGTKWSSALEVILRLLRRPDTRLMQTWGDRTMHGRLEAWSRWQRGRYVEQRPTRLKPLYSSKEYRLTEEGKKLLSGLPTLDVAPPFKLGSFRFYRPGSWVMTAKGPKVASRRVLGSMG